MEKTQDVPEYEIEGLMRTSKELGIKGYYGKYRC